MDQKYMLPVLLFFLYFIQHSRENEVYYERGNYTLIGLINYRGTIPGHAKCSEVRPVDGLLPLVALIHAVNQVNKMANISSKFKLGLKVFDICDETEIQLTILRALWTSNIAGVIGPTTADDVAIVAVTMNIFQLPVVNFNEIPLDIDNQARFNMQHWLAPSIKYSAHALIDIAWHMGWDFVGLVFQSSKYGWVASEEIKKHAKTKSICFSHSAQVKPGSKARVIADTLMDILSDARVSVIILALEETELVEFLESLKLIPRFVDGIQFLSTSKWGTKQFVVRGNEENAKGIITVQPQYKMDEEFSKFYQSDNFLKRQIVSNYTKYHAMRKQCDGEPSSCLRQAFGNITHSTVAALVDSVYGFASVFAEMHRRNISHHILDSNGRKKMNRLYSTLGTRNGDVYPFRKDILNFGNDRRVRPYLGIYNYQKLPDNQGFGYKQVGHWTLRKTARKNTTIHPISEYAIDVNAIQWRSWGDYPPQSTCSKPCHENEIRNTISRYALCCWVCVPCGINEVNMNGTCIQCRQGEQPNQRLSSCTKLPHRRPHLPRGLGVFLYTLTTFSMVVTLTGFAMFVYFRDTRVVRASSRELSTFIFIGMMLWNAVPLFLIGELTKATCFVRGLFLYLGYSLVYAPLFLKTNRIYRIFQNGKVCTKPPKAVSPLSQVLITSCFCCVQIMLCLVRLNDVELKHLYPKDENMVEDYCGDDLIVFSINLAYILVIMAATTFYSFKTRHFPKNYNESKYIGITMYITCFISAIALVSYFAIRDNGIRSAISSLTCLLCSNTVLFCLFTKKLYVLIKGGGKMRSGKNSRNKAKQPEIETDCNTMDTDFRTDSSLSVPAFCTDSPRLWDLRRLSGISMLSILGIQKTEEYKGKPETGNTANI